MNPLLNKLNLKQNNLIQQLSMIKNMFDGKNPNDVLDYCKRINPQFKKFADENEDKTVEDICMEYDIDINLLKKFL